MIIIREIFPQHTETITETTQRNTTGLSSCTGKVDFAQTGHVNFSVNQF